MQISETGCHYYCENCQTSYDLKDGVKSICDKCKGVLFLQRNEEEGKKNDT